MRRQRCIGAFLDSKHCRDLSMAREEFTRLGTHLARRRRELDMHGGVSQEHITDDDAIEIRPPPTLTESRGVEIRSEHTLAVMKL